MEAFGERKDVMVHVILLLELISAMPPVAMEKYKRWTGSGMTLCI